MPPEELHDRALVCLRQAVTGQPRWIKVHAAENLLALGLPQGIREAFLAENEAHAQEPQYRVGIWRVLTCAAAGPAERQEWLDKVRHAFLDVDSPDRLHAAESLAKIGYAPSQSERAAFEAYIRDNKDLHASVARWGLANSRDGADIDRLAVYLGSEDTTARLLAAMGLQKLAKLPPATWQGLAAAARSEPVASRARVYMLAAAYATAPTPAQSREFHAPLAQCLGSDSPEDRKFAAAGFAQRGDTADVPLLQPLLNDADADVQVYAAGAILWIDRRDARAR